MKKFIIILAVWIAILLAIYLFSLPLSSKAQVTINDPRYDIVAIGDSLTYGYRVARPYPLQLSEAIGKPVFNCGFGGSTLQGMNDKFDNCTNANTHTIIIWGGANDIRWKHDLATMKAQMTRLVSRSRALGARVIIINVPPTRFWSEGQNKRNRDFNKWLRTLGTERVGAWELLKDPNNMNRLNPVYELKGIHPTEAGYKLVVDKLVGLGGW